MPPPTQVEFDLMLLAARSEWTEEERRRIAELATGGEVDWKSFFGKIAAYGVAPLAARRLAALDEGEIGGEASGILSDYNKKQTLQSLALLREALRLLGLFGREEIPILPYKGPILGATAYGDPALRPSGDLDFLIQRPDLDRALELLEGEGYENAVPGMTETKIEALLRSPHEYCYPTLKHRTTGLLLELHFDFSPASYHLGVDLPGVWRSARPRTYGGVEFLDLTPGEWLPILCLHGARHHWSQLKWICDIAELLRRHPDEDWRKAWETLRPLGLGRCVLLGLYLAFDLFGAPIPSEIENAATRDKSVAAMAAQVRKWLRQDANQTMKTSEFRERLRFQLRLRDRRAQRWGYFLAHLSDRFLPERILAALYGRPK